MTSSVLHTSYLNAYLRRYLRIIIYRAKQQSVRGSRVKGFHCPAEAIEPETKAVEWEVRGRGNEAGI